MRILIADDEAPDRARLKRLLGEIEGVEVLAEAENGVQALERIEQERPDLVLLDIQMPGLDGFGVVEALEKPVDQGGQARIRRPNDVGDAVQPVQTHAQGEVNEELVVFCLMAGILDIKFYWFCVRSILN